MPGFLGVGHRGEGERAFLDDDYVADFQVLPKVMFTVSSSTAVLELRSAAKTSGTSVPSFNTTRSADAAVGGLDMVGLASAGVAAGGTEAGAACWALVESWNAKSETVRQNAARMDRKKKAS
jgi:hypothetical protein